MNRCGSSDDEGYGINFSITCTLEAGKTYILGASFLGRSEGRFQVYTKTNHSGSRTVLQPASCTEHGLASYVCDGCNRTFTEIIPADHAWDEHQGCTACGKSFAAHGQFGDRVTWTLDLEGNMVFSGEGEMGNANHSEDIPWNNYRDQIETLVMEDGITSISDRAFEKCNNLARVDIPESITMLGGFAFQDCHSLRYIDLPDNLTYISNCCFLQCYSLLGILIPENVEVFGIHTFYECKDGMVVVFAEDAPELAGFSFYGVKTTVYYPAGNDTWTDEVMQDYGGALTWVTYAPGEQPEIPKTIEVASGTCGENLTWMLDDLGILTISGTGPMENFATGDSPWAYDNRVKRVEIENGVTSIGDFAFCNCNNLSKVVIPDSVASIGASAFTYCESLLNFRIPGSVRAIGNMAFYGCWNLKEVVIQEGTSTIGESAFEYCEGLEKVTLPKSIRSIGDRAFYYCTNLKELELPEGIEMIGSKAFTWCSALELSTIPNSVTSIGDMAFSYCSSITEILIPHTVAQIGLNPFAGCENLTAISVDSDNSHYSSDASGVLFNEDKTVLIAAPGALSGTYKIPDGVSTISLVSFAICAKLTGIEIPNSVTTIESQAFQGCEQLNSITIPASVVSLGDHAFYECYGLTGIYVDPANPNYSSDTAGVLFVKNKTTLIQTPAGITGAYTVPEGVTSIGKNAFSGCYGLNEVTISDTVTSIGDYAFSYCSGLQKIELPDGITSIGSDAFFYCSGLQRITLPKGVISIAACLFEGCSSLSEIEIPDGVVTIQAGAFRNCDSLKTIAIPDSVTSIGLRAFSYCDSLNEIIIPKSVSVISNDLFEGCVQLTRVILPDSITSIESGAFAGCKSLPEIRIPASVTSVRGAAFSGCENLKKIVFEGDAPSFGGDLYFVEPFERVTATAYYPAGNATWTSDVMQNYGYGEITWVPYTVHEIIEEGTGNVVKEGEELAIHTDADHNTLVAVYMDGVLVDPVNYTVTEGSTIITFSPEFLATLAEGDHKVTVEFEDGLANATITVQAYTPGDITGDNKVNNRDAARLMQYLAGWDVEFVEAALDVNGDGKVNNRDAARLMQYLAGWDVEIH